MFEKNVLKAKIKPNLCQICKTIEDKNNIFNGKCIYDVECPLYNFKNFSPISQGEAMEHLGEINLKELMTNFKKLKEMIACE